MHEQGAQKTRSQPKCARCKNHNIEQELKNHKRFCDYINCNCEKCFATVQRQKDMAMQTAKRRAAVQDQQRRNSGLPIPSPSRIATSPLQSQGIANPRSAVHDQDDDSQSRRLITSVPNITITAHPDSLLRRPTPRRPNFKNGTKFPTKELWDTMDKLRDFFHYPVHVTPLLYIILTEVTHQIKDVSITIQRIKEAEDKLRRIMKDLGHQTDPTEYVQPCTFVYPHNPRFLPHTFGNNYYYVNHHSFHLSPSNNLLLESVKLHPIYEANVPIALEPPERINFSCSSDDRTRGSSSSFCSSLSGPSDT